MTTVLKVRSASVLSGLVFATEVDVVCCAGPLPKVLPTSLELLTLGEYSWNTNKFTGGIPPEWGDLTNLNELNMVACGLDGKPLRTRSERLNGSLTCNLVCVCRRAAPRDYSHEGKGGPSFSICQRWLHTPIEYWRAWRRHHKTRPLELLTDRSAQHPV